MTLFPTQLVRVTLVALLCTSLAALGVDKANNTTNLNSGASWTGGSTPNAFNTAQWTNTFSAGSAATPLLLGGNVTWGGITILDPGGAVTIGAGNTMTLSGSGINMGAATQNLTIQSGISLLTGSNQVWNVVTGRTLTLNTGTLTRQAGAGLNVQGSGTITTTNISNVNGLVGPWATVGSGATLRFATVNGSNQLVGFTTGTAAATAAEVTDTTGTVNYDLAAGGALVGTSFNTVRYTGAAAVVTGGFSSNGLLNVGSGEIQFSGGVTVGSSRDLVLHAETAALRLTGDIVDNAGGASTLTKSGPDTVYLTGSNSYTGMTTINEGVLDVGTISNGSLGAGGLLMNGNGILQGNGTFTYAVGGDNTPGSGEVAAQNGGFAARGGELIVNFGGNATPSSIALNGSGYIFGNDFRFGSSTADSAVVVLNPIVINTNGKRAVTVTQGVGGDSAELRGVLSDGGASFSPSGINKNGNGLLILSANNTFTGGLQINDGTVSISTVADGGLNSNLGASSNAASNLIFNGGGLRYTGATGSTDRSFTINAGKTATIEVTSASAKLTISGNTTATSGALTKTGAGTLSLPGAMLNTGMTSIQGGILDVGDVSTLGTGGLLISNGSLLQGYGSLTLSVTGNGLGTPTAGQVASQNGGFAAKGGTLTVNLGTSIGLNTSLYVFGNNLIFGSPEADSKVVVTSNINLNASNSNRTVTVNAGAGGDSAELTGNLTENSGGNSGLTKNGDGFLALSGTNTYTRGTTVNAGSLFANYTGGNAAASSTGTGDLTIAAAATLGGFGKVGTGGSLVTVNGALSPGDVRLLDTRDTLTVDGNLLMAAASMTKLEVASLADFDKVAVTGLVTLDGTLNVDFAGFDSLNFASNFTLDVYDWSDLIATGFTLGDGSSGDLQLVNVDYGGHTGAWDLSQFLNTDSSGGTISWNATVVPEPSRVLFLLLGLGVVLGRRRRVVISKQ